MDSEGNKFEACNHFTPFDHSSTMSLFTNLTDRALVEAFLLTREEWAFRLLYQRHNTALWRLALRMCQNNGEQAEDVLQDVWLRGIEKLPQFRWDSSLRTWLSGFVLMRVREQWRTQAQAQKRLVSLDEASEQAVWPDQQLGKADLLAAIERLPTGYKMVLSLYDLEGFKHEEIASLLNISVGTSKSQLSRARSLLRTQLEENPDQEKKVDQ